jgi:hypothetical protein
MRFFLIPYLAIAINLTKLTVISDGLINNIFGNFLNWDKNSSFSVVGAHNNSLFQTIFLTFWIYLVGLKELA